LLLALERAQESFAVLGGDLSPELLKLMPGALRVPNGITKLRGHIHRMDLAFALVTEIQVRAVTVSRVVCAGAGGIAALTGGLRQ